MAVIAIIMGILVGIGLTLKLYWFKIKEKISKNGLEINNNNFFE